VKREHGEQGVATGSVKSFMKELNATTDCTDTCKFFLEVGSLRQSVVALKKLLTLPGNPEGGSMKRIWLVAVVGMAVCVCGCKSVLSGKAAEQARPAGEQSKAPGAPAAPGVTSAEGKGPGLVKGSPSKGEVLAKVGGTVITDTMVDEKINAMPMRGARFQSPMAKKELLNSMVELEVVYQEAVREGLDKDKETFDRLEDYKKRLVATRLREKFLDNVKVSDDEIKVEYRAHADRYKVPKQVKVSQILFVWDKNASEKDIAGVKKNAQEILERVKKGEDFAALAKKYSLDQASAAKGGDIGYANGKQLPSGAYIAAMAFEKEGAVSDLIIGKEDIRILKATEVVPEKKKSIEELRSWLERAAQSKKQREAWQNYMDGLKKKGGVAVYEDKLAGAEEHQPPVEKEIPMQMRSPLKGPRTVRPGSSKEGQAR
jgi:parvulin-like peptidyl-prolyl isomerase